MATTHPIIRVFILQVESDLNLAKCLVDDKHAKYIHDHECAIVGITDDPDFTQKYLRYGLHTSKDVMQDRVKYERGLRAFTQSNSRKAQHYWGTVYEQIKANKGEFGAIIGSERLALEENEFLFQQIVDRGNREMKRRDKADRDSGVYQQPLATAETDNATYAQMQVKDLPNYMQKYKDYCERDNWHSIIIESDANIGTAAFAVSASIEKVAIRFTLLLDINDKAEKFVEAYAYCNGLHALKRVVESIDKYMTKGKSQYHDDMAQLWDRLYQHHNGLFTKSDFDHMKEVETRFKILVRGITGFAQSKD